MVLWEIALATAYFLGLKPTYKLALKIQGRLIPLEHPRTRQFVYRRTRAVFDMAVRIHKHIQERDIEVGQNLGNWILRWLDKAKPSAEIRGPQLLHNTIVTKQLTNVLHKKTPSPAVRTICSLKNGFRESGKHLFSSTRTMWRNRFPPITMMMPGINNQYRNMSIYGPQVFKSKYVGFGSEGVVRKDIVEWLVRN
ncbi:hypothetical protein ACET3Z_008338 [Daucus carota]